MPRVHGNPGAGQGIGHYFFFCKKVGSLLCSIRCSPPPLSSSDQVHHPSPTPAAGTQEYIGKMAGSGRKPWLLLSPVTWLCTNDLNPLGHPFLVYKMEIKTGWYLVHGWHLTNMCWVSKAVEKIQWENACTTQNVPGTQDKYMGLGCGRRAVSMGRR